MRRYSLELFTIITYGISFLRNSVEAYGMLVGIASFEVSSSPFYALQIIYDNVFYSKIVCRVYEKINISTVDAFYIV